MFRWKRTAVVAAVVALGLTGCSGHTGTGSSGTKPAVTLGIIVVPHSFDATEANWGNEAIVEQAAYDTLLHADAKTAAPLPWLAKSWTYSADKKTLTLTLQSGVKFSDGTAFNAAAVVANFDRYKKGTSAELSQLANVSSVTATDATTAVYHLSAPDPALLSYLAGGPGLMESPKAFSNKNVATVPVGTGPYIMDTANTVQGSKYVFTANPNYWAKSQQYFSKVTMPVLTTSSTVVNAIKGKQIDGINIADQSTFGTIQSSGFTIKKQALDWQGLAIFDRDGKLTPALGNVKVRQALNYAVDRAAILKAVLDNNGTVTTQVFPTFGPAYDAALDDAYPYDVAKAKALMKEAGYANGFTLNLPIFAGFGGPANDLIKQYFNAIGIKVTFTTVPVANVITDLLGAKYSASYFSLQEDPTAFQEANFLLTPAATFNPFHTNDPKVVAWTKTMQTGTTAQYNAAAKALGAYVVQQAWNVPFYRDVNAFAQGPNIVATPQAGNAVPYLYNIKPKS